MKETEYDLIRPYNPDEIPEALERILKDPLFQQLLNYLIPEKEHQSLRKIIPSIRTRYEFHQKFMHQAIQSIVDKTSDKLSYSGIEHVEEDKGYVFIANHRDIFLDSSLLALVLIKNGLNTCEMTWGNNLMVSPFIVDAGKVNGMITVFREGSPKEMLQNAQRLSSYIRTDITQHQQSVWIAQRKGRSKDGNDTTDVGVLKMLSLSGKGKPPDSLTDLDIIPVSISYEWEPCDTMKVRELYMSQQSAYIKDENEDLQSIIGGVVSDKGRIHISIGKCINDDFHNLDTSVHNNMILEQTARLIDRHIHSDYHLWPSNYLAYDMLEKSEKFADKYDESTVAKFKQKLKSLFEIVDGQKNDLESLFLKLYANPVYNKGF